jgi:hypothetical protein
LEPPGAIGSELSWFERIRCTTVTMLVIVLNYIIASKTSNLLLNQYNFSVLFVIVSFFCIITVITIGLYVYNVYIVNLGGVGRKSGTSAVSRSQSKSNELDTSNSSKRRLLVEPQ